MTKLLRFVLASYPVSVLGGLIFFIVPLFSISAFGQNESPQPLKTANRGDKDEQSSSSLGEMIIKQQISRRKKDHDELLKRGDEVLKLSEDLERSFAENETFSAQDISKLQTLEKAVSKIRSDLGGDDDDDEKFLDDNSSKETTARQNIVSAFRFLQESTKKLVDELKRTSRFSISAAAIQTSNTVIRFARFLRLKQ